MVLSPRLRPRRAFALGCLLAFPLARLFAVGAVDPQLPPYHPARQVTGELSSLGDNTMETLMDDWFAAFHQRQPHVEKGPHWEFRGTALTTGSLMFGLADVAPSNREPWPSELEAYREQFGGEGMTEPFFARIAGGAYEPQDEAGAIVVYVNAKNPLAHLSFAELDAIFGQERRRGLPAIQTWGQLGLTGEWADRPIFRVGFPIHSGQSGMSVHFQRRILNFGPWVDSIHEEANVADIVKKVAETPGAIGFGGILHVDGAKILALGEKEGGPYYAATAENVANRSYPFSRYIFLAMNKRPGSALPPAVREFMHFILSREGQEIVARHQYFFTLTAAEAAAERERLQGRTVELDAGLEAYTPHASANGSISSVGSDQMRSLMDSWMQGFRERQPGVHKGEPWEHYGAATGFQALFLGEADVAPVDRDPWTVEGLGVSSDLKRLHRELVDIRVGRRTEQQRHEPRGKDAPVNAPNDAPDRYVYLRVKRTSGEPLPTPVAEFLRYILSRDGQERVLSSPYLPLTAAEAKAEEAKLP